MKPQVVMKFGGTSVGTPEAIYQTAKLIRKEKKKRHPLVVISALSGVTNLLIASADAAKKGAPYLPFMNEIFEKHDKIIAFHHLDSGLLTDCKEELSRLLSGVAMLGELSPRIRDILLSFGERMSVRLLADVLSKMEIKAFPFESWKLGFTTDQNFSQADLVADWDTLILEGLSKIGDDVVPIVTGFIGRSIDGEITTLGRGGSDFSASIFGAAANVEEIQIWTDVPGFLRADPRVVQDPQIIPAMRFEEAAELAYFGAKVLHPRTMEPAMKKGIPIRVLGTFHEDSEDPSIPTGTLINESTSMEPIRAMALRESIETLHIHSLRMLSAPGFLSRVFAILRDNNLSVDVIATSEVSISMTFDPTHGRLQQAIQEISAFAEVDYENNMGLLCLVGGGLRKDASVLGRIFSVLGKNQIPVFLISQGASRINLTLVTETPLVRKAMEVLHEEFFGKQGK